jgi:hypothetical protein
MSSAIKLPDAVHRRIHRYEKHKETFLHWLIEAFVETGANQTSFTPTTQFIIAGSSDNFSNGFNVSTSDLVPMAEGIRDSQARASQDVPEYASEMIRDMKTVNSWYAGRLQKGDYGWTAHVGHKYYANQLENAINHIRRGSNTADVATPAPAPRVQDSNYEASDSVDMITRGEALVLTSTIAQSSNVMSAMYEAAPESNGSNVEERLSRSSTVSSTRITVTRSGSSGNLDFQSRHHEFGHAIWRSGADEESSSEEDFSISTTLTRTHATFDRDMEHKIESQLSERLDPSDVLDIENHCLFISTQERREASSEVSATAGSISQTLDPRHRKSSKHYATVESDFEESEAETLPLESPRAKKYPHYILRERPTSHSDPKISLSRVRNNEHSQRLLTEAEMTVDSFDIDAFEDCMFKLEAIERWNDRYNPEEASSDAISRSSFGH